MKHHSFAIRSATRQLGLSLVELMIAMTLGLIVLAGVLSLFMTNKQSYTLENAVAQIQEGGRFSLDFMRPQIRQAGYTGCANQSIWSNPNVNLLKSPADIYNFAQAIQGYDYKNTGTNSIYTIPTESPALDTSAADWNPVLPANIWSSISSKIIPGSDIIMIHSVTAGGIDIDSFPGGGNSANVKVTAASASKLNGLEGQIGYVTNCQDAAVFQITNVNVSSGTAVHSATGTYSPGNISAGKVGSFALPAQLYTMQTYVYFIGLGADSGPSLYMAVLSGNAANYVLGTPQELVSGVENMQILYGVDTDADGIANQYVAASDIANWSNVSIVSVRIGLLVRSDSGVIPATNVADISQTKVINDATITPPATAGTTTATTRRMRKIFVETITLRNHVK